MAFRGRPVSDLRFEDEAPGNPLAAASDGTDYLMIQRGYGSNIYGQMIAQGAPYGGTPWQGSDFWIPTAATWNGSEFVVAHANYDRKIRLIHTSPLGYATDAATLTRNFGDHTHGVVFPPRRRSVAKF
jgi:hypothetical protein